MEVTVLGVLEFSSIAIGIQAMDAMVKAAPVKIIDAKTICPGKYVVLVAGDVAAKTAPVIVTELRLATGMGGKSYVKIMGLIDEVESAMKAAVSYIKGKGLLCQEVVIPKPHPDIKPFFL